MSSEPGISAIWYMSNGVGKRNVLMKGVVKGHSYRRKVFQVSAQAQLAMHVRETS